MLNIAMLAASVVLQFAAAVLALRAMRDSGSYRYPWIALSLALELMVERRAVPLVSAIGDTPQDLTNVSFGLLISMLMAFSLFGLGRLLHTMRDNEARLTHLATTDTLTGIANRRMVLSALEMELNRAGRTGRPLALLMLDLDLFKSINDRHGHAIGDAVLVATAARCQAQLRGMDTCGRIGGEEFLVVLPETGADEARVIAERLRATLGDNAIDTSAGPIAVTVSIGLALFNPMATPARRTEVDLADQVQELLRQADQSLYRAKSEGRNCVRQ
jgi:diguanylate cyclase (GGDEF)-like protein